MQEIEADPEKLLNNPDVEIRRETVEKLRGNPLDTSVKFLLKAMKDTSWRVRKTAVDILLEEYPVEAYINGLIGLLYLDDNAGARNSAIEALIKLDKKVTSFLIESFNTQNRDVRKFIIDVLGELRDRKSLPLMLDALKDEDDNVRASAVEHLGKIGEPAVVNALIEILESGDLWTAYPAADALGRIGDRTAIPSLIKALSIKTLREPVLKALSRFSAPETLKHIVPFLEDSSKTIQEETVKTIRNFYHNGVGEEIIAAEIKKSFGDRAIDMLVSHAWSSKPEVRVSAILLLGIMKDERAITPLLELSIEEDLAEDVKRAFVFIGRDKPGVIRPLLDTVSPYQKRFICDVAGEIASPLFYDILERLMADNDGHVRTLAAIGISRLGDIRAIGPIKNLLSDVYSDVQEAAVTALSTLKEGLEVEEFIKALSDRNPIIRKNSAFVLGEIGAVGSAHALGFALKDDDVDVRHAVVKALSLIKTDDSVKYLTLALTDETPDIRASAAISLGMIKRKGVSESLILLLADRDDTVRVAAIKALGELGDRRATEKLIRLLSDPNGFVVTATMEALSRMGGEEARKALIKMLISRDKEIKRTAIKALAPFEAVEDELLPFLNDDDWATRMATVEVLDTRASSVSGGLSGKVKIELERLLDKEDDPIVRKAIEESLDD
ncbi:MAG: HEAT repeat domain-containing protein [Nitrospirae bacterium]|nr:HEAT repeat domain-containing protein [Nitrospirota bacterium]